MLRSLFAGVSGLAANTVEIDVIGNNISNVNTVGFKSSRVTFEELLTQNLRSATRPTAEGMGGTNPQQIGLGTVVGSIDSEFTQGNLRTTGNKTDLAIQGDGFFVLDSGNGSYMYSRAGNFTFDGENTLVAAGTGARVQGVMADDNGNFASGAVGDITIDPSTVVPAQATTSVNIFGNLSSNSDATGTHMASKSPFLAMADASDELGFLHAGADGADLMLTTGDRIALIGNVNGVDISDAIFTVGEGGTSTVQDLATWIQDTLNAAPYNGNATVNLAADGTIQIQNGSGGQYTNLKLNIGGRVDFNQLFNFGNIDAGAAGSTRSALLSPATSGDLMSELYNGQGSPLNFAFDAVTGETTLQIQGTLGGEAITPRTMTVVDGTTTFQDYIDQLSTAFAISNDQGVTLTPEGILDIVGDVGARNDIDNIQVTEPGNELSNLSTSFDFEIISEAQDAKTYSVTTTVYDSLGNTHNLTLDFTKRTGYNIWDWQASFDKDEQILAGQNGTVSFDEKGSLVSFLYTDGGGQIRFQPQPSGEQGAEVATLTIDPGSIGGVNGLTQFEPQDQLQSYSDGFTVGRLVDFDVDGRGVVTGRFSNDTVRDLARVTMARFNNPQGLVRQGNNTYVVSGNSGQAIFGYASEGGMGSLTPGALEASNVDLSEQFTRLVVAQRAYQSNARIISTGDEILQELVNLV